MPVICVHRYTPTEIVYRDEGTQFYESTFVLTGPVDIELDGSTYTDGGYYTLIDYSSITHSGYATVQDAIDALLNVTVVNSDLQVVDVFHVPGTGTAGRIVVQLFDPYSGTWFYDTDLIFTGPTAIYLYTELYPTAGTYNLFVVEGTVTGLSNIYGNILVVGSSLQVQGNPYTTTVGTTTFVKIDLA